ESVNQSYVLDGDSRLMGEGYKELDLRGGERTYLDPACSQCANKFAFLAKGNEKMSARAAGICDLNIVLLVDVREVKRPVLSYPAGCCLINTYLDASGRNGTELSPRNQLVSLAES